MSGVESDLSQVFTNLLVNAAAAIDGTRETNEIRVTARLALDRVVIDVADGGSGIAPEALPFVFDPFFTTRGKSGGSGLGLAICQRIVSEHDGALTVTTAVGRGTTFRISLPALESAERPPSLEGTTDVTRRARVLLIDDDPMVARSIKRLLSASDVTLAGDGRQALALLLQVGPPYDLVLCDVTMPVMDGVELRRALADVAPALAAGIVFVTGGLASEEARELVELGNEVLLKPLDPGRLLALVRERLLRRA